MTRNKIIAIIGIVLFVFMLVLQFLPYWQYDTKQKVEMEVDGEIKKVEQEITATASVQGYSWVPDTHKDLTKLLQTELDDKSFAAGYIVAFPAIVLFFSLAGIIITLIRPDFKGLFLFPLVVGIAGIWCLSTFPVFKVQADFNGTNYSLQYVAAILLTVFGFFKAILTFKKAR